MLILEVEPLIGPGGLQENRWAREIGYHLSFWRFFFFFQFYSTFWPQFGQLWCCDVFPDFKGISGDFGVLEPRIHHLSFSGPNGLFKLPKHYILKGKWPIFEAKNTIKKRQKDKWYPFHACTGKLSPEMSRKGV